jgi:hypothetical protein
MLIDVVRKTRFAFMNFPGVFLTKTKGLRHEKTDGREVDWVCFHGFSRRVDGWVQEEGFPD